MKMKFIAETLAATVVFAISLALFGAFVHGTVVCLREGITFAYAAMAFFSLGGVIGIAHWVSSSNIVTQETLTAAKAQAVGII